MHTVIAIVGVTKKHQKLTPLTQNIALFLYSRTRTVASLNKDLFLEITLFDTLKSGPLKQ